MALAAETKAQQVAFTPSSDEEVLVVLPKSFFSNRNELAKLRDRLKEAPEDPELAAAVASQYLSLGNGSGDPRYYGYARAAIDRWWTSDSGATASILKIRAKLKEKDHLYEEALLDLEAAAKVSPDDAQILLEIGNIHRVKGRYQEATEIADRLQKLAGDVPAALCRAPVMAQTGMAQQADDLLKQLLPEAEEKFPSTVQFILTIRAEIADALGHEDEVREHYVKGLDEKPDDFYLLRSYGDFLLDRDQNEEALELLTAHTADTGVLLRAAIAAQNSGQTDMANRWTKELETRFEEIRLRGGQPHGRFKSRLALELKNDPPAALSIALENWQKQKEVRDTRNVLEAAIAAKDVAAAEPVLKFLRSNANEHVVLKRLVQELENVE